MRRLQLTAITAFLTNLPAAAHACSICFYGDTDTPANRGLRWGVLTLLAFLFVIMAVFVRFLIIFRKRSSMGVGET